jgi:hypothetical protein
MVLNLVLTPDRPERDETPVSSCSSEVKVRFHLVQRGAAYHLTRWHHSPRREAIEPYLARVRFGSLRVSLLALLRQALL